MRKGRIIPAAALLGLLMGAGTTLSACRGHPGYNSDRGHHHDRDRDRDRHRDRDRDRGDWHGQSG